VRQAELERVVRRCHFDDPGVGPSHAPLVATEVDFEDIRHSLEVVLQDVPEGIWSHIQDEGILEQFMGFPLSWWAIVRLEAVNGTAAFRTMARHDGGTPTHCSKIPSS
jgi:hypothetical protein